MILLLRLKLQALRLAWPATLVLLLLQRTPLVRLLAETEFAAGVRVAQILRALLPAAATLGAVNTLTGQTQMVFNPGSPVSGTVGQPLVATFAYTGGSATPESYSIVGTLPPGMAVLSATGAAGNLTVNGSNGIISGTPTASGAFIVQIEAFDGPNRTGGDNGSSGAVNLTFNISSGTAPPGFTTHPATQTVNQGANVTFTVVATGGPPPTLQWRKDTVDLPGQTGPSLVLTNVTPLNAGTYVCVATNANGSLASNPSTLTVRVPPAFTTHPATQTVNANADATFTVVVTGSPTPTLQWRRNNADLAGQTGLSLVLNNVSNANEGTYTCVATNAAGSTTSNPASLTVNIAPAFTTHPATQNIGYRDAVTFTVVATGEPTPTLQWRRNGADLPGQTGTSFAIPAAVPADNGVYDCVATNSVTAIASNGATLTVTPPPAPTIATQPLATTALQGSTAYFAVIADGLDVTYQWRRNAVDLPGQTRAALILGGVNSGIAGNYSVRVSNPGGFIDSDSVALNVVTSGAVRLVNLSARARVGTGDDVLIPGFVVGGSGDKSVLVRAVGPKLDQFGVSGFLADPTMQLFRGAVAGEANDDWQLFADQVLLETTRVAVGGFSLTPSPQPLKDASMVVSLAAGPTNYTVKASGVGATSGVALVELFDADPLNSGARFINISARAVVGIGGDILIPGFFIEGDVALTLIIRAVGPTLQQTYGVNGALVDPVMTLFRITDPLTGTSEPMTSNDDWGSGQDVVALEAARVATGGFELVGGSADSAMLVSLNPGGYTVKVEGKNGTTGVALMEIYLVGP